MAKDAGDPLVGVGARMRALREQRKISLRALARMVEVTPSLISQIETGKINPSVSSLYAIATALDVLDGLLLRVGAGDADGATGRSHRRTPSPPRGTATRSSVEQRPTMAEAVRERDARMQQARAEERGVGRAPAPGGRDGDRPPRRAAAHRHRRLRRHRPVGPPHPRPRPGRRLPRDPLRPGFEFGAAHAASHRPRVRPRAGGRADDHPGLRGVRPRTGRQHRLRLEHAAPPVEPRHRARARHLGGDQPAAARGGDAGADRVRAAASAGRGQAAWRAPCSTPGGARRTNRRASTPRAAVGLGPFSTTARRSRRGRPLDVVTSAVSGARRVSAASQIRLAKGGVVFEGRKSITVPPPRRVRWSLLDARRRRAGPASRAGQSAAKAPVLGIAGFRSQYVGLGAPVLGRQPSWDRSDPR